MIIQRFNHLTAEHTTCPLLPIVFGDHDGMTEGLTYVATLSHRPQGVQQQRNVIPAMTLEGAKIAFMKTRAPGKDWFPVAMAKTVHDALELLQKRCEDYKEVMPDLHRSLIWYVSLTMGGRLACRTLDAVEKDLVIPSIQDIMGSEQPTDDAKMNGTAWGMWTDPLYLSDNMEPI